MQLSQIHVFDLRNRKHDRMGLFVNFGSNVLYGPVNHWFIHFFPSVRLTKYVRPQLLPFYCALADPLNLLGTFCGHVSPSVLKTANRYLRDLKNVSQLFGRKVFFLAPGTQQIFVFHLIHSVSA